MKCLRNHLESSSLPTPNNINPNPQPNQSHLNSSLTNGNSDETSRWLESVNINRLEELLKRNKQRIDSMDERGQTLLHLAILANRLEIVRLLINLGANVTLANRDGWSPLHIAAYSGNSDIINFLLQNKL